jgi:hypothetical protein
MNWMALLMGTTYIFLGIAFDYPPVITAGQVLAGIGFTYPRGAR